MSYFKVKYRYFVGTPGYTTLSIVFFAHIGFPYLLTQRLRYFRLVCNRHFSIEKNIDRPFKIYASLRPKVITKV